MSSALLPPVSSSPLSVSPLPSLRPHLVTIPITEFWAKWSVWLWILQCTAPVCLSSRWPWPSYFPLAFIVVFQHAFCFYPSWESTSRLVNYAAADRFCGTRLTSFECVLLFWYRLNNHTIDSIVHGLGWFLLALGTLYAMSSLYYFLLTPADDADETWPCRRNARESVNSSDWQLVGV